VLRRSGVTQAMLELRDQYRQQVRGVLVAPAPLATEGPAGGGQFGPQNHVGTCFGEKWSDGRPTGKRSVIVMVRSKVAEEKVLAQMLVPAHESVKGERVTFDVIEVGQPLPLQAGGFQTYEKPAPFGASVGLQSGPTGTLGCRVWRRPTADYPEGQKCILSNNHVLADVNEAQIGADIMQPGDLDAWGGQRKVGDLVDYVKLNLSPSASVYSAENRVDAALAFTSWKHAAPRFHDDYAFDPTPVVHYQDMAVFKEGRTTGYTKGIVRGVDADLNLPYRTNAWGQPAPPYAYFTGQILIEALTPGVPFSKGGDSGSLVCGLANGVYHPTGLLFAGNNSNYTWANPIQEVFDALDIGELQYDPNE
jgi:hypothetical protein